MFRILIAVIVIALFPFIGQAEEQAAKQHTESQTEEEERVLVTVSIEKKSGEVRILIENVKGENKEELQKSETVLPDDKEPAPNKKHSRRRGK